MISKDCWYPDEREVLEEVQKHYGDEYILCCETAADSLGLALTSALPLRILVTKPDIEIPNVEPVLVQELDYSNLVDTGGVKCTNKERTLIELLTYDTCPNTTCVALANYYFSEGERDSWKGFHALAEQHGVLEEFESYIEDALDYYNH